MPEWVNWAHTFRGHVSKIERPRSLAELQRAVLRAVTSETQSVHAQGSTWAFSAPAYCEDVIVDTDHLRRFPKAVQRSIVRDAPAPGRLLVAAEAGMKVRDFYRAIAFDRPRDYAGPRPALAAPLRDGRIWTLPVLGGAGGQSLAGVISTGTHGGDVARPPLSDAVRAMILVAGGGDLVLMQPAVKKGAPPVVDASRLSTALRQPVADLRDDALFRAALVSIGRFGVIWTYVLEVRDETDVAVVETRTRTTWEAERRALVENVVEAGRRDEFYGLVVNPYTSREGRHACYVTRHKTVPGHPTDAELAPRLPHVVAARRGSGCHLAFQALGFDHDPIGFFRDLGELLDSVLGPPYGPIVAAYALERFGHVGHRRATGEPYLVGDMVADVLELLNTVGRPDVIELLNRRILEIEQREELSGPFAGPWQVKGTRFEIADFYDYSGTAYLGDSIEVFFPVQPGDPARLPAALDALLHVFDVLRAQRMQVGAYVAIRFMERTRATLGLARWSPTCSAEIAVLRGLRGNELALRLLRDAAIAHGGVPHWGQRHELTPPQVAAAFGPALTNWRTALHRMHRSSKLFSSPFTRQRDLEWREPAEWGGWTDLRHRGAGAAAVSQGFDTGDPLMVAARSANGTVDIRPIRPDGSGARTWVPVRPEPVEGAITLFRGSSGRLELFAINNGFLTHTWEETRGGAWAAWDVKGYPAPIRYEPATEIAVTAHDDGRLETFGRAGHADDFRLGHCWANGRDSWGWSTVLHRGLLAIASSPSAANRRVASGGDHLIVVSTSGGGRVQWMQQTDIADNADWSEWETIRPVAHAVGGGGVAVVAPARLPLHVFVVGANRQVRFTVDSGRGLRPRWEPWIELSSPPVEADARLAVTSTPSRVWVGARTLDRQVLIWELAPGGRAPILHDLRSFAAQHVSIGAFPAEDAVYVVARDRDDGLRGRRLAATP